MSTAWEKYKEKNGVTPLDLLNPRTKQASRDLSDMRYDLCLKCPELIQLTKQCKKCGCFMSAKTKLESAKCPLGKW